MQHENLGKCLDAKFDIKLISPNDGYHYFYGYYDLNPYHENGKYHLANRVSFIDRLPTKDDVCELGYIDLETNEFTKIAETTAWNFQQGALLTYNKANYDEVFYNVRGGENDYQTCIHNLKTNEKRYTDRACANISLDGKYGLALNFNRIYDFRPGYGYSDVKDKWFDVKQPDDDGIYLVDMESGKSKLIISAAQILKEFPNEQFSNEKFVVNHITFNTTGDRFLFLFRNFMTEECPMWSTTLITSDLEGNMYELLHNTVVSHYHWKNEREVLFAASVANNEFGIYLLEDMTKNYTKYESPYFKRDIHCLYSPNQKYFIGDGYPDKDSLRGMYIYNNETGETDIILREYSHDFGNTDLRCDLHNRWNVKGDKISYDSTRNGKREIYEINVSSLEHN